MKICFYDVDLDYITHLKNYEIGERGFSCVPNIHYNSGNNKFVYGTVLQVQGINYFVPVSSKAHNKQDDIQIKVKDKKNAIVGTLRFAYMIPIPQQCLKIHDISIIENYTEKERCRKELAFCRKNREKIQKQAEKTYFRIKSITDPRYKDNCCDFEILERAFAEYCQKNNIEVSRQQSQPSENPSILRQENIKLRQEIELLKNENAEIKAISEKRAESIRTANLVLSANSDLKKSFVEEKKKLIQYKKSDKNATKNSSLSTRKGKKP